ncbi:MAG: 30S ribosomal protein S16 [Flavobacteriaceae bacterium]|nr:30S ribosomal protein S16 [Flavobacteriaceae bacterium]
MAVKLRLQRHGKKGYPFYWIVAADSRSKRDGKFLEKIGTYNPNTNPATINLDQNAAIKWIEFGAQPTDTTRTLLSYKGILLKLHLKKGVAKGALTEEQGEEKFQIWKKQKEAKIQSKIDGLTKERDSRIQSIIEHERKQSQQRTKKKEVHSEGS